MKITSAKTSLWQPTLCLLAAAVMAAWNTQAQSFVTGFEDPPYTSGVINGQDAWTSGQTNARVLTASEIEYDLTNATLSAGTTVHSGSQALLISDAGGGATTIRPISGVANYSKVTMDLWARPLTSRPDAPSLGNVFMTMENAGGTRAAAFRFGFDSATTNAHIDYADGAVGSAIWNSTGIPWESNTWYHITLDVDYAAQTYDFSIDGTKVNADPIAFYSGNSVATLGQIRIYRGGNQAGMIMDDLSITSVAPTAPVAFFANSNPYGWKVVINDAGSLTPDTNTITATLDGVAVIPTSIIQAGNIGSGDGTGSTIVAYDGSAPTLATGTQHTNTIHFEGSGFTAVEDTFNFTIAPVIGSLDRVHHYLGRFQGTVPPVFSGIGSGHTGLPQDLAADMGNPPTANAKIFASDPEMLAAFNNAFNQDQVSCSIWIKRHGGSGGSDFWFSSPSASGSGRAYQLHCPYYNDADETVFFDTDGASSAAATRASDKMVNFPPYSGFDTWWSTWHHVVTVKNGGAKQVWIDGQLFIDQTSGAAPLSDHADLNWLTIGAAAPDNLQMNGWVDDFAVYAAALDTNQIVALFNGTAPDAIAGASTSLLAWWDFNDGAVVGMSPGEGPAVVNFSQVLQSSTSVNGPFTDVSGATSPYTNTAPEPQMFFRARKY